MEETRKDREPGHPPAPAASAGPAPAGEDAGIRDRVINVLRTVFDPEIPVNIYELGLVYLIEVDPAGEVYIRMTLTSPACPVAGSLPPEVETKVRQLPGVKEVKLDLVWDPPWDPSKMSEAARLQLGM